MNEHEKNIAADEQPEILVNNDQATLDPTVVVSEADRTVVLTEDETIVFEKPMHVEIVPSNRPRKVYGGMWGPMELGAFAASLLTLVGLLALYVLVVVPSNRELEQTRAERDQLEQELISARSKYGDITNIETTVAKLVSSVNDFESIYLPIASTGRTSLYQRLNGLIVGYGLLNTNGPNFAPLEFNEADQNGGTEQPEQERGRAKFRSIFPGVYVTMTVEGSYQNLRKFIREIETSNEFVIISSVELEPTETKKKEDDLSQPPAATQQTSVPGFSGNQPARGGYDPRMMQQPQQQVERPQGKTHGETVSLRLEMAAYFRRADFAPPVEE